MLEGALVTLLVAAQSVIQSAPTYRVEREPASGGAELVTVFGRVYDSGYDAESREVPLLSVLRDTLGDTDPENDRLRYVWILTRTRPTPLQRAASAVSFVRFRTGSKQNANRVPSPALDLASPAKSVWPNLFSNAVQSLRLDPLGATVRTSTRSYRADSSDYRRIHLYQALSALEGLEQTPELENVFPAEQLREVHSRLSLSDRTFGGLVRRQSVSKFYDKDAGRIQEMRGHNWELLRQRAEYCGLYFEPLELPGGGPAEALLWIARSDLEQREQGRFERQFLNIANPWTDGRLLRWSGYTQVRYFDQENRLAPEGTPGAREVEMIPLALYSLDYPRVPLLLVDFRNTFTPKRRELVQHGANAILTGVLGITRFGNLTYLAADSTWNFVRRRRGVAVDRAARLRAYSEARAFLAVDSRLDPKLKTELTRRLDHLAVNPLENNLATEAKVAREQYAALLQYAGSPQGLAAKLERDRRKELDSYTRSRAMRLLAGLGRLLGSPKPVGRPDPILLAQLDSRRRAASRIGSLEALLSASPRPEVVRDPSQIRMLIEALSAEADVSPRASQLIGQIYARSADSELRIACLRALQRLDVEAAQTELLKLAQDPHSTDQWRALCLLYYTGENATGQAGAIGAQ